MSECMMPTCPVVADRDGMCEYHRIEADVPKRALQDYMAREHRRHQDHLESGYYERLTGRKGDPVVLADAVREAFPKLFDTFREAADAFQDMGKAAEGFHTSGHLSEEEN